MKKKRILKYILLALLVCIIWKWLWEFKAEDIYDEYTYKKFITNYTPAEDDYQEKLLAWEFDTPELRAYEEEAIKIDEYNFKQLEKVKQTLSTTAIEDFKFANIEEFNKQFQTDITPIKNCYYVSRTKNIISEYSDLGEWYIFWFKLESKKYRDIHNIEYYAYPKYNLKYWQTCNAKLWPWWLFDVVGTVCWDHSWGNFKWRISRACR